jgi:hypothetical protein
MVPVGADNDLGVGLQQTLVVFPGGRIQKRGPSRRIPILSQYLCGEGADFGIGMFQQMVLFRGGEPLRRLT